MASWLIRTDLWVIVLVALALFEGCAEAGYRLGRLQGPGMGDASRAQYGAVQASVLGLLGLLLAFTFNMAVDRYDARRTLLVEEANAIGTAWLRADALEPARRDELRGLFRRYVDARLAFDEAGIDPVAFRAAVDDTEALQAAFWPLVTEEARRAPDAVSIGLLMVVANDVIDLHTTRLIAREARIPAVIVLLLAIVGSTSVGIVGFTFGLVGRQHRPATALLSLLVILILALILDLDRPHRGFIRVSEHAMHVLRDTMDAAAAR